MKRYLHIIQKEISKISENDLDIPLKNTNIDSLDLTVIRVVLEKHFGFEIDDVIWYKYQTLSEAIEYFHKNRDIKERIVQIKKDVLIKEKIEIEMPQMANSALSENWLLKHIGNTHWQLISKGFKLKSSEFKDEKDNRLYAAFIRINYSISTLNKFSENEIVDFSSTIKSFGNSTFISKIKGVCENKTIIASLATTFAVRENENNNRISKSKPKAKLNGIKQLIKTPVFLTDYRLMRKGELKDISTVNGEFEITDASLYKCEYIINPYYDINGVGLLYYASYPMISDICIIKYNNRFIGYNTIYRDIFYFANANQNENVLFELNSLEENGNEIKITTSLFRSSDKQIIAKILTFKMK